MPLSRSVGYGKTQLDACQDAHTVESGYALYPVIERLEVALGKAFDKVDSALMQKRLGGLAYRMVDWMRDYDSGKSEATYLAGFNAICDALEAFHDCDYEISTDDIWSVAS